MHFKGKNFIFAKTIKPNYMETTPTNQSPVAQILDKHNSLSPRNFSKWLITNSEKLKNQDTSANSSVALILEKHENLHSLNFTKWLFSNSNDLQM